MQPYRFESVEDYFWKVILPLGTAMALGGLLGLERQMSGHKAGMRTQMLVAMGAALFAMLATLGTPGDSTAAGRILQGVAAGVGFIGAGAILKDVQRRDVSGLTSASSIWMAAAVGAAAGLRVYALALTAGLCAFGVLRATRQRSYEGPPD